ncbi:MAG: hypothetical protein ISR44_08945 [Rhodospirillales bacterium]|nr:hypothetical protein [Rhodospirillales bacterium]
MGDIIEPPPPDAPPIPEETAATPPPAPARPEGTPPAGPTSSSPVLLNRLGNLLGLKGETDAPMDAPPPAAPGTEETATVATPEAKPKVITEAPPEKTPEQAVDAPETPEKVADSEPAEVVPDPQPEQQAEQAAAAPPEQQEPENNEQFKRDLSRTVDTYLGGWFVKWLGRKIGVIDDAAAQEEEPPATEPETTVVAEAPTKPAEPDIPAQDDGLAGIDSQFDANAEIDAVTQPEPDADTVIDVEPEPEPDTTAEIDAEPAPEPDIDVEPVPEPDLAAEIDTEPEIDVEPDVAAAIDTDLDTEVELPADAQIAEAPDDLDDPFAPEAVPPGSAHPVIGEDPVAAPQPPEDDALAGSDMEEDIAIEDDPGVTEDPGIAEDLGTGDDLEIDAEAPEALDTAEIEGELSDGGEIAAVDAQETELDALADDLGVDDGETDAIPGLEEDPDPQAADGGGEKTDLMGQLSNFLEADDALLETDEPADPDADADTDSESLPGLEELDAAAEEIGVTQTASVPPMVARQLPDKVLTLGESIHLTAARPETPDDPSEEPYCVEKNAGKTVFCVEMVDWPPDLGEELAVSTIMYQGSQAIVRYDDGMATRYHAIFPSEAFDSLVSYYTRRFGEPTETNERTIAPFAQPRQINPILAWRRDDPLSGELTTLEIRRFDDARGGFPDLKHGVLMLANAASSPIFPILSALDLMPTTGTN